LYVKYDMTIGGRAYLHPFSITSKRGAIPNTLSAHNAGQAKFDT